MLKKIFGSSRRSSGKNKTKRNCSFRPMLERLEDRITPTTYTWQPTADIGWEHAYNWYGRTGYPSGPGDSAVFSGVAGGYDMSCILSSTLTIASISTIYSYSSTLYIMGGASANNSLTVTATSTWDSGNIELDEYSSTNHHFAQFIANSNMNFYGGSMTGTSAGDGVGELKITSGSSVLFQNGFGTVVPRINVENGELAIGGMKTNVNVTCSNLISVEATGTLNFFQGSSGDTRGGIRAASANASILNFGTIDRTGAGASLACQVDVVNYGLFRVNSGEAITVGASGSSRGYDQLDGALEIHHLGALTVIGQAEVSGGDIRIAPDSSTGTSATITTGSNLYFHSSGTIYIGWAITAPNAKYITLNIVGDFEFNTGELYMELQGEVAGNGICDKIHVSGTTTIDGGSFYLYCNLTPGVTPTKYQYDFIDDVAGAIVGDFTSKSSNGNSPPSGWDWSFPNGGYTFRGKVH